MRCSRLPACLACCAAAVELSLMPVVGVVRVVSRWEVGCVKRVDGGVTYVLVLGGINIDV